MTSELEGLADLMHSRTMSPRRALLAVAVLFAVGEALDSIDVGLIGLVFAALFAVGAFLLHRGKRIGLVLVGTLIVIEVAAWPTFKRHTVTDWLIQVPFLCIGLFGLIALATLLFRERRSASGT